MMKMLRVLVLVVLCGLVVWGTVASGFPLRRTMSGRPVAAYPKEKLSRNSGSLYYPYNTKWYNEMDLDHFNFADNRTFSLRYLTSVAYYTGPGAPIFFYTGNEGDVEDFANNTGFVFEAAQEFGAAVVFAEHRYYGETMPFGDATYNNAANLAWLSSEQALSDYAVLVVALKDPSSPYYLAPGCEGSPVIAFGGSYGGMLSSWFRMKFPHLVAGAVAASAPIWQFTGVTPAEAFNFVVTRTFNATSPACPAGVSQTWALMEQMAETSQGCQQLAQLFGLCSAVNGPADLKANVLPFIAQALVALAQFDYPYPCDFGGPLPANPATVACGFFEQAGPTPQDKLVALAQATNLYYNYSGEITPCLAVPEPPFSLADLGGWNYQTCNEMVMPMAQDGVHDMFYPLPWNLTAWAEYCMATYGISPRPLWVPTYYGGHNINQLTNIVFSNGNLDPWSSGGVLTSPSASLPVVYIVGGAHHLDLRSSNPLDPQSVIDARNLEKSYVRQWITEWVNGPSFSSSASDEL